MSPKITDHVPDEWLWMYCEQRLQEPELSTFEEHLRNCERCRGRLTDYDEYRRMG